MNLRDFKLYDFLSRFFVPPVFEIMHTSTWPVYRDHQGLTLTINVIFLIMETEKNFN